MSLLAAGLVVSGKLQALQPPEFAEQKTIKGFGRTNSFEMLRNAKCFEMLPNASNILCCILITMGKQNKDKDLMHFLIVTLAPSLRLQPCPTK